MATLLQTQITQSTEEYIQEVSSNNLVLETEIPSITQDYQAGIRKGMDLMLSGLLVKPYGLPDESLDFLAQVQEYLKLYEPIEE